MTDEQIRQAFEKWYSDNCFPHPTQNEYEIALSAYKAALASLEPIPRSESGLEPLYRIKDK